MTLGLAAVGVAGLVLTGCSSSSDDADSSAPASAAPTASAQTTPDAGDADTTADTAAAAQAVAEKLGCQDVAAKTSSEMFVEDWYQCDFEGKMISIYTFATPQDQADWTEPAVAVAGAENVIDAGDSVVVLTYEDGTGAAVAAKLG